MKTVTTKSKTFGYFINRLRIWQNDIDNCQNQSIPMDKAMKLLFFSCSLHHPMLDIFDNFIAVSYGHVEIDLYYMYRNLEKNNLSNILDVFENLGNDLEYENKEIVDKAIEKLKNQNPNLVCMKAFDLVEISQKWESWNYFFDLAKINKSSSEKIPTHFIKFEKGIFC